jgi:ornithine cyclodeaminase/alanine dehydrogenase-like protein (mu-crystallin family)
VLSAADVAAALPMREAIEATRRAFGQLASGEADMALRSAVRSRAGTTLLMPAYLADREELAVKLVSVYPRNEARGLPLIHGLVVVLDPETGVPLAAVEGAPLTALRTGAVTGLATDLLARDDASVLALFGAGAQAGPQLDAICAVRPIREVRVYTRDPAHAAAFVASARERAGGTRVVTAETADEAVRGADVIVAATSSATPVFDGLLVEPGAHVVGVGSFRPDMQEVDAALVLRAKIVVDQLAAALEEAGDLVVPMRAGLLVLDRIHAELGDIVIGERPGRESRDEITFFKSVGLAIQDAAVGAAVVRAAVEGDLGVVAPF